MSDAVRGYRFRGVEFRYVRRRRFGGQGNRSGTPAFRGEALDIGPGLTLVLGPNGSGKSTLLKLAAGIERPETGSITLDGHDLWREERVARQGLAYVPEQPDLSPYAALGEVMRLVGSLRGLPPTAGADALGEVGLDDLSGRSIRQLSMGQRRRAMFAAAFIGTPTTLILDEPLETLDRTMRERIVAWLRRRLDAGVTAVVSTHEIEPFLDLATTAIAMRGGEPTVAPQLPDGGDRLRVLDRWARGGDVL